MIPDIGAASTPDKPNLPDEFWDARESLARIRQAAHSRHRPADAVLHIVLARLAAMLDPVRLDTGVGSVASLNYFAAVIGAPGSGKSDAWSIACELYPAPAQSESWFADNQPLGTGEGLAEIYMGTEQLPSTGKGKPLFVRKQVRRHAFVFADEGEALTRHLERAGATVGESLRRAWKGVPLGQRNAAAEHTRHVVNYSLGLAIGFQPSTVGPLLADVASGTPQRFIFASAYDPSIPDTPVPWPEPRVWWSQYAEEAEWSLDAAVREEISAIDLGIVQGRIVFEPYDAHAMLSRVKVAGLLAALEQRKRISREDWDLSLLIWKASRAVRGEQLALSAEEQRLKALAGHQGAAQRELTIEEAKERRTLDRAVETVVRHVLRKGCEGGCKRRCLQQAMSSGARAVVTIDVVLEEAVRRRRLVADGDAYRVA